MKVTAYKNIDVEVEVDIDLDEFIAEFRERTNVASETHWRRMLEAMDAMTRIMATINLKTIAAIPKVGRELIATRLSDQSDRWYVK